MFWNNAIDNAKVGLKYFSKESFSLGVKIKYKINQTKIQSEKIYSGEIKDII